jgi:hypothetical protein
MFKANHGFKPAVTVFNVVRAAVNRVVVFPANVADHLSVGGTHRSIAGPVPVT